MSNLIKIHTSVLKFKPMARKKQRSLCVFILCKLYKEHTKHQIRVTVSWTMKSETLPTTLYSYKLLDRSLLLQIKINLAASFKYFVCKIMSCHMLMILHKPFFFPFFMFFMMFLFIFLRLILVIMVLLFPLIMDLQLSPIITCICSSTLLSLFFFSPLWLRK